jgi:hypothetical protein
VSEWLCLGFVLVGELWWVGFVLVIEFVVGGIFTSG